MDLFIVDYGIESSESFREKRSSWVVEQTQNLFQGNIFWPQPGLSESSKAFYSSRMSTPDVHSLIRFSKKYTYVI